MLMRARLIAIAVKRMRIAQTINSMNQCPGKNDGHQREQQVNNEMPVRLTPFHADEKSDSEQRSGCGHHDEKENQEATEILLLRYLAYFALRCRHYCHPIKRKDNDSDCIPTSNRRAQ